MNVPTNSHVRVASNHVELLVQTLSSDDKTPTKRVTSRLVLCISSMTTSTTEASRHLLSDLENLESKLSTRA